MTNQVDNYWVIAIIFPALCVFKTNSPVVKESPNQVHWNHDVGSSWAKIRIK